MRPLLKELAEAIEQVTGVTFDQLRGSDTKRKIVTPRLYFYLIAREKGMTYREIGEALNKSHTTVMRCVVNAVGYVETDKDNAMEVKRIKALLAY